MKHNKQRERRCSQGFPAAVVCPEGCGVRSWRLRSCLGQQRPPCSWKRGRGVSAVQRTLGSSSLTETEHHQGEDSSRGPKGPLWRRPVRMLRPELNLHNSTDSTTVALPHAPEARLTPDVPQLETRRHRQRTEGRCDGQQWFNNPNLDGDVALRDLPHVETNRGNHVFTELARLESMTSERDCEKY